MKSPLTCPDFLVDVEQVSARPEGGSSVGQLYDRWLWSALPSRNWAGQAAWLLIFSIAYLVVTSWVALRKALWYDELFTYYIAQVPRIGDIWSSLHSAADLNPPVSYLIARFTVCLLGDSPFVLRLPAMLGCLTLCLCLYLFVLRRCAARYAWLAALLPLGTEVYRYAYEARPYGLVLGFCGLALVCWQVAAERRGRPWTIMGLAFSLALAVGCHYYAVLLVAPFALAEIVRAWTNAKGRRLDLMMWLALAAPLPVLVICWPLIAQGRSYFTHFWSAPSFSTILNGYCSVLKWTLVPIAVVIISGWAARRRRSSVEELPDAHGRAAGPWSWEVALAIGLALLPIVGTVAASLTTNVFHRRYALASIAGISLLTAFLAQRWLPNRPRIVMLLMLVFLAGYPVIKAVQSDRKHQEYHAFYEAVNEHLASSKLDEPIVVSEPLEFLPAYHHAPAGFRGRLLYLTSADESLRHLGHDTPERALQALGPWARLPVEDYETFLRTHPDFLLLGTGSWQLKALTSRGKHVEQCGRVGVSPLLRVRQQPLRAGQTGASSGRDP